MARKETYTCDIHGCDNEAEHKNKKMQVLFVTEQNEGRSVYPYLDDVVIDICEKCLNKIIENRRYITAYGAMGYNDYKI